MRKTSPNTARAFATACHSEAKLFLALANCLPLRAYEDHDIRSGAIFFSSFGISIAIGIGIGIEVGMT